jgi:iron(III) transport system permease protein
MRRFLRVSLPMARPAIIAGLSLALMETLADFGTVQYFGVPVFTTGIFRTWFGLGDSAAAAQLSALLMSFVFVLIVLERWSRRRARYHHVGHRSRPLSLTPLSGGRAALAAMVCVLPPLLGFLVPTTQLAYWSVLTAPEMLDREFIALALNSFALALAAAVIALVVAVVVSYGKRLHGTPLVNLSARVAGMGYAVPGTVIAVGVMIPFAWVDRTLDGWMREAFGISTGLLLSGTLFTLLFAYTVRFLAVSLQTVEAGLTKLSTHMDDAARSLGYRPTEILTRVHIPCINGALLTAVLIVFVDVLKELPATLILRPFNFNTLAVRTYELASDERLADAALSAIAIVLVGILPILVLSRAIGRSRAITAPQ